jgi:hypothetical protein
MCVSHLSLTVKFKFQRHGVQAVEFGADLQPFVGADPTSSCDCAGRSDP